MGYALGGALTLVREVPPEQYVAQVRAWARGVAADLAAVPAPTEATEHVA